MKVRLFDIEQDPVNVVLELIERWGTEANFSRFGMDFNALKMLDDIAKMVFLPNCGLLCLYDPCREGIIGFMGLVQWDSPLGKDRMAEERYWYVLPEYRTHGHALLRAALQWAKGKQCSHFIASSSNLASDLKLRVDKLYQKTGGKEFETRFIWEV